ncbi:retrovirus-related pol polyprotein from transposon TNT 1-94 [Tanacetum coccineum]
MSTANQQTLAELGASDRPLILEKRSYVPWASRFMRFLENKKKEGELIRDLIFKGIPNDINNSVDACLDAQTMWARIRRLMQGSDIKNQAVIQDGYMDIQSKNVGYAGNGNMDAGRKNKNQATNARNGLLQSIEEYDQDVQRNPRTESTPRKSNIQCYNYNEKGHYAGECPKPRVRDAKYFREQMLLATKYEAGVHLDEEENDFMLDNAYGDNTLEELNAAVIMMALIQPTDDKSDAKPTYDAEFISEVNTSQVDMINGLLSKSDNEKCHNKKLETIIHTSADDQINSDIIFDDPYVDNNSGQDEHETNAHHQSLHDFKSLIINVQVEAEKQRKMNIELKRQKVLLQRELETCKERVKEFENKPEQALGYKEAYEKL